MPKAEIVIPNTQGYHNTNPETINRLTKGKGYQDLSTICIIPTPSGMIPAKVVQSWLGMMTPMNQKFIRMFAIGMEVGDAYSQTIESILAHPDLSNWKYILTLEHDNCPQPDSLLKLYENIDKYDAIGGLYYTKGEGGAAMCYGNPKVFPKEFQPQIPIPDTIQECNGLGMGFTLFKMEMLKDKRLKRPLFETIQKFDQSGAVAFTQDLAFFFEAGKYGYKFACDTRVKVAHYDHSNDMFW